MLVFVGYLPSMKFFYAALCLGSTLLTVLGCGCDDPTPSDHDAGADARVDGAAPDAGGQDGGTIGNWSFPAASVLPGGRLWFRSAVPGGWVARAGTNALAFFDTTDPDTPQLKHYERDVAPTVHDIAAYQSTVYVLASAPDGSQAQRVLEVYALSTESGFELVNTLELNTAFYRAAVEGERLYLSGLTSNTAIYDLLNPTMPAPTAVLEQSARAIIEDGAQTIIQHRDGISLYENGDFSAPTRSYAATFAADEDAIAANASFIYAVSSGSLLVFERGADPALTPVHEWDSGNGARGMWLRGSTLFVLHEFPRELTTYDVSNPASIVEVHAQRLTFDQAGDFLLIGDLFYGGDSTYDVSNPAEFVKTGEIDDYFMGTDSSAVSNATRIIDVTGNALCVGDLMRRRFYVIDLRQGLDYHHTFEEDRTLFGQGVIAHDGYCYVSSRAEVAIYDVRNAEAPVRLESAIQWSDVYNLGLADHYLLVAAGNRDGLIAFDVSDPTAPTQVAQWVPPENEMISETESVSPFLFWATGRGEHLFAGVRGNGGDLVSGFYALRWTPGTDSLERVGVVAPGGSDLEGVYGTRLISSGASYNIADPSMPSEVETIGRTHCTSNSGELWRRGPESNLIERYDHQTNTWMAAGDLGFLQGNLGWASCENDTWLGAGIQGIFAVPLRQ